MNDEMVASGIVALIAGMGFFFLTLGLAVYAYCAMALMTIAKRTGTPNEWMAWIPIANVFLMTQVARQNGWMTLILLAGAVPVIGGLVVLGFMVWLWWQIAERLGYPSWWGVLMLVPIANFVIMGIMAWGKPPAPPSIPGQFAPPTQPTGTGPVEPI